MSTVSISYGSLKDASNGGKSVAKKLDNYADAIRGSVYNKLNSYGGSWTSNITTASNNINSKISELRGLADKYERYADNLMGLRDECKRTDEAVKKKVSTLTATFKADHGISNSKIQNTFSYLITSMGNSTAVGRWLGDGKDKFDAGGDYLKECIQDWYEFEGGEDLIKGGLVALLEIAIGVASIAALVASVIITGGASLALIAGAIAGLIGASGGIMNLINEGRAYNETRNGDPATGKRLSKANSVQDYLRTETDSHFWHNFATGIDVVNIVCSITSIAGDFGTLLKKGYKWTTGCTDALENISLRNIFNRSNFSSFVGKLRTTIANGWIEVKAAIRMRDTEIFRYAFKKIGTDFSSNLRSKYSDFSEDPFETTTNILKSTKGLVEDGLNLDNILSSIALPCVPIAGLPTAPGQGAEGISIDDFSGIIEDINSDLIGSSLFSKDSLINDEVLEKLSVKSDIKIKVSDIHIPKININIHKLSVA